MKVRDDLRCPECGSAAVYTARLKGIRSCKRCGHAWPVDLPEPAARENMEKEKEEEREE